MEYKQNAAQKKEDRRVRLTKRAIRESLIELMHEYPIEKISVKMIADAADINRSTFYAHYKDQYDLISSVQSDIIADLKAQVFSAQFLEKPDSAVIMLVQILEYGKANATLLKVLLSDHGNVSFHAELMQLAQEKIMEEFRGDFSIPPRTMQYLKRFALTGLISIMQHWLNEDCNDEPEMLAELMLTLIVHGSGGLHSIKKAWL